MNTVTAVGTEINFRAVWQSPWLPAPTLRTSPSGQPGRVGWLRVQRSSSGDGHDTLAMRSMEDIRNLPYNGMNLVSLFSGCGGSCLGFRIAGFLTKYASEFVRPAREVYWTNHRLSPDPRDIRSVETDQILEMSGLRRGEIDVVEGSPPCASFTISGKKNLGWDTENPYSNTRQRTDDLFWEYARLIEGLQPKVFVAENVRGLIVGKSVGYFKAILARLRECGYQVECQLLDAAWLGVPQVRKRLIFIGVRNDLGLLPKFPEPFDRQVSVRDVLTDPVMFTDEDVEVRKYTIEEVRKLCSFPEDFVCDSWERFGRAVPPLMMAAVARTVRDEILLKL